MEQHPIPQQISSYQFRLVGDMTLKQFFQVAAGALISLLIYSTGLHPIIKWPLIIFFCSFGAALAFLPFQERPLEKWVIAFFRSIYSPTFYFWKPYEVEPAFFQPEPQGTKVQTTNDIASTSTANTNKLPFMSNLEEAENNFLNKLSTLFTATPAPQQSAPQPPFSPSLIASNLPVMESPITTTTITMPNAATRQFGVSIPNINPLQIVPPDSPMAKIAIEEKPSQTVFQQTVPISPTAVAQVFTSQGISGQAAQFSQDASPPAIPEYPNLVSGQVMDSLGKIVEGAILEIKDQEARPVRALKSNKAGHFMIVTPLLNGKYELEAEKEGLEFDLLTFEAKGEIIQPIAIRSKNAIADNRQAIANLF